MAEERRSIQTILAARQMFGDDVLALKLIVSCVSMVWRMRE
jgi:hypothetical protein